MSLRRLTHPHAHTGRRTIAALTTAAAFAAPATAGAMTVSSTGSTLTLTDQAAHAAVVSVGELDNPLGLTALNRITISANSSIDGTVTGCSHPTLVIVTDPNTLTCDRSLFSKVVMNLGDGNDTVSTPAGLTLLGATVLPLATTRLDLRGEAGDDSLTGGAGDDRIDGGAGLDTLYGAGGDDTLIGGSEEDYVYPGPGANTVDISGLERDHLIRDLTATDTVSASTNDEIVGGLVGLVLNLVDQVVGTVLPAGTPTPAVTPTPTPAPTAAPATETLAPEPAPTASATAVATPTVAPVQVTLPPGLPSITDILAGKPIKPSGTPPIGITLPLQPIINDVQEILGKVGADVDVKAGGQVTLPPGITLDLNGLHVKVNCAAKCEASASAVVDLGNGQTIKLQPGVIDLEKAGATQVGLGIWPQEWAKIQGVLQSGKCTVLSMRMRLRTEDGEDRVVSYALPACGTKVALAVAKAPVATAKRVTRRIPTTATCSQACDLKGRFLQVKSGNTIIAALRPTAYAKTDKTGKVWKGIWKLSAAQAKAIRRARKGGFGNVRYVVSTSATAGGVTTVGSSSFRAHKK